MNWKKLSIIILIILIIGLVIFIFSNKCYYNDPSKRYVAKSVRECAVIDYVCQPNEKYFHNDCGCGCEIS